MIGLKRAYEPPDPTDGWRVLVDRIWPRGLTRERLRLDAWEKEAAPSPALRRWFGHDPAKWETFRSRYFAELDARPEVTALLRAKSQQGPVTLVYAARDSEHSHALALREYLVDKGRSRRDLEPADYASPPCFMHELDPEWLGASASPRRRES